MKKSKLINDISLAIRKAINEAYRKKEYICFEYKDLIHNAESQIQQYIDHESNCISYEALEDVIEIPDVKKILVGYLLEYGELELIDENTQDEFIQIYISIDKCDDKNVFVNSLIENNWGITTYIDYNVETGDYDPGEDRTYWSPGCASSLETYFTYTVTDMSYIGEGGDETVGVEEYVKDIQNAFDLKYIDSKYIHNFEEYVNQYYLDKYESANDW